MKKFFATLVGALILSACANAAPEGPRATALMKATAGNTVGGTVSFVQKGDLLVMDADISGLPPNTEHGIHIHEKGDCSAADGSSAGGHFNPTSKPHGHYATVESHAGDMPNLKSDANGIAKLSVSLRAVSTEDGASNNIVGRSVVIHAAPDDYRSQPAGNSGARIACGVIQKG